MPRRWALAALLVAGVGLASLGCRGGRGTGPTLTVLSYSEYIDPELLALFRERTGVAVVVDVYEDTETMLAKLGQGGLRLYDVVVASDYAVTVMDKLGLLGRLDLGKLPGAANLMPRFRRPAYDPEGTLSMPYQWGTVGLAYRPDRFPRFEPTWAMLFDPARHHQPFVLIDSMRDMLGVALKSLGASLNATDPARLRAAGELVLAAKARPENVAFDGSVGGKNKLLSGTAALAVVYSGDALRAVDEDAGVAYVVPREGSIVWVDAMVVPRDTKNREAAHRFIDFILEPEVGARLSRYTRFSTPNARSLALLDEADRANPLLYPSEDVLRGLEYIGDVGEATRLYDEVWTAIKAR